VGIRGRSLAAGKSLGIGRMAEDAFAAARVALVGPFPAGIQGGVMFSAAAHSSAKNKHEAEKIIRCLITPAAKEKLRSARFDVT
jgi:ABC-type molybdate transport system substrate-binding protein